MPEELKQKEENTDDKIGEILSDTPTNVSTDAPSKTPTPDEVFKYNNEVTAGQLKITLLGFQLNALLFKDDYDFILHVVDEPREISQEKAEGDQLLKPTLEEFLGSADFLTAGEHGDGGKAFAWLYKHFKINFKGFTSARMKLPLYWPGDLAEVIKENLKVLSYVNLGTSGSSNYKELEAYWELDASVVVKTSQKELMKYPKVPSNVFQPNVFNQYMQEVNKALKRSLELANELKVNTYELVVKKGTKIPGDKITTVDKDIKLDCKPTKPGTPIIVRNAANKDDTYHAIYTVRANYKFGIEILPLHTEEKEVEDPKATKKWEAQRDLDKEKWMKAYRWKEELYISGEGGNSPYDKLPYNVIPFTKAHQKPNDSSKQSAWNAERDTQKAIWEEKFLKTLNWDEKRYVGGDFVVEEYQKVHPKFDKNGKPVKNWEKDRNTVKEAFEKKYKWTEKKYIAGTGHAPPLNKKHKLVPTKKGASKKLYDSQKADWEKKYGWNDARYMDGTAGQPPFDVPKPKPPKKKIKVQKLGHELGSLIGWRGLEFYRSVDLSSYARAAILKHYTEEKDSYALRQNPHLNLPPDSDGKPCLPSLDERVLRAMKTMGLVETKPEKVKDEK